MSDETFAALTEWRIKMENNQNETSKDIALMKQSLVTLSGSIEAFHIDQKESITNFRNETKDKITEVIDMINRIDSKKADVWVEKAMSRLNWIVVSAVLGAVIYLVIK